jgi:hypothetical protein
MKKCTKCGEVKQPEDFYRNKNANDGKAWYCKECSKKIALDYIKKPVKIERYLNMIEVFKYDSKNNLIEMYHNVLDAVEQEEGISSVKIYKVCLGREQELQGYNWSFEQVFPQDMIDAVNKWIKENL